MDPSTYVPVINLNKMRSQISRRRSRGGRGGELTIDASTEEIVAMVMVLSLRQVMWLWHRRIAKGLPL